MAPHYCVKFAWRLEIVRVNLSKACEGAATGRACAPADTASVARAVKVKHYESRFMSVLCRGDSVAKRTYVSYDMSSIWSCLYQVGEETKR